MTYFYMDLGKEGASGVVAPYGWGTEVARGGCGRMGAGGGGSRRLRCELCGFVDFGVCSISGVKEGGVDLL